MLKLKHGMPEQKKEKEETIIMNTIYVASQVDREMITRKLILPAQILLEWKKVSPGAVSLNNNNIQQFPLCLIKNA